MKTIRKDWPRVRQYVKAGNTYFSVRSSGRKPPRSHLNHRDRQNGDAVFEDSQIGSFPLKDWGTAATIVIFLTLILNDGLIEKPTKTERQVYER
jgi:hypothetical protein